MIAVKGNKEYTIEQSQQKFYQDSGYDIKDDSGKIVAYGKGKTIPYGDYMKVAEDLETLKAQHAKVVKELEDLKPKKGAKKGGE
jgi:hypothetical protein|nr:MAG TPA: hypothetical protein [Caudoviricetes sp.]